jgi:hypothetical protein
MLMARLVNGINGPIIGKVGTVTGSHRNGKGYIKGNNIRRAKQTPNELIANMAISAIKKLLEELERNCTNYLSDKNNGYHRNLIYIFITL